MNRQQWEYVHNKALQLFSFGQRVALEQDLLLVDTKYEFGSFEDCSNHPEAHDIIKWAANDIAERLFAGSNA